MPKIDIDNYIEQSGMRKARFGGYEPEDVHQAMEDLCADYEQHLTAMTSELRTLRQENDALRKSIDQGGSQEEMERIARDELGLVSPGERVFVDIGH